MTVWLILLLMCPMFISGQVKGDGSVCVSVGDNACLFERITQGLEEEGYYVESSDKIAGVIKTRTKKLIRWNASIYIRVEIKEGILFFSGMRKVPSLGPDFVPVRPNGIARTLFMESWDEVVRVALLFGNQIPCR